MHLHREPKAHTEVSTQRIEAFSDGIFSIAITLLVLEIKVPELPDGGDGLAAKLLSLWPSYFGYVFSFVMIGIHWANHHYIFKLYERSDHNFLMLNIFYLMCISFLPFPTAVLARYIEVVPKQETVAVFYALGLFLPAFAWLLMWLYASLNHRLLHPRLDANFKRHLTRRYFLTNLFYLGAIALSFWHGLAGLGLCVGLTLLYILPTRPPVYTKPDE
jgi:uncharacterized membrane protein